MQILFGSPLKSSHDDICRAPHTFLIGQFSSSRFHRNNFFRKSNFFKNRKVSIFFSKLILIFNECARVLVIPQRLGGVWPLQTSMIHEHWRIQRSILSFASPARNGRGGRGALLYRRSLRSTTLSPRPAARSQEKTALSVHIICVHASPKRYGVYPSA